MHPLVRILSLCPYDRVPVLTRHLSNLKPPIKGLEIAPSRYPMTTKGFLFSIQSDQVPENVFNKLAIASAHPSIIPKEDIDAPKTDVKKWV